MKELNPVKIALIYALAGGLWILFRDMILVLLIKEPELLIKFHTYKGWFFVVFTTLILYWLLNRYAFEQKKLEAVISSREKLLSLFVEHSPAAIAMFDRDMRYIAASRRFITDYNLKEQDVIGRSHYEVFPELPERWKEIHRRCLNGAIERCDEDPFLRSDESLDWVQWEIHPWYDTTGEIGGIILFSEVITKRKQTEDTLRKSEELFRAIASNTPDHILMQDSELRYTFVVNPQLGLTEQGMIGKTDYDFLTKEEADKLTQIKRKVIETGEPLHFETSLISKEGDLEFFDGTYVPKFNEAGHIDGLIGYFRNVTERKKVEAERRQVFERVSDAFVALDLNWRYTYLNEKAGQIFGCHPEDLIGKHIWTEFPEGVGQPFHLAYERALAEQVFVRIEEYYPPYDRWFENRIYPSPDGLSIFFTDITERKKAELELEAYRAHLEEMVRERTEELRQANERLKEVDRLKSMFIASMSHELRTPLNSIIGFSRVLLDGWAGTLNDEQRQNLEIVLRAGRHLLALINDVIDVSKIEAGTIDINNTDFDIYDVIKETLSSFEKEITDRGLNVEVESVHQMMHTDRRRLIQCIYNLLSNAVKFTERGSISVQARLIQNPDFGMRSEKEDIPQSAFATPYLETSVSDTGIGIKEEDIALLFKPFVRLESHLKAAIPGTGLGLYLTQRLVTEALKGDIIVESTYGKGSRFTIRIPVSVV